MTGQRHIHPVPDSEIAKFLQERIAENNTVLRDSMAELAETVDETWKEGQPPVFAYGKLQAWLVDQPHTEVLKLCAAAMWLLEGIETDWTKNGA